MPVAVLGLSNTGEGALIAVAGGIVTLVASQLFSRLQFNDERRFRQAERHAEIEARRDEQLSERTEWYRRLLFERRLKAVSEAYGWAMELNQLRNLGSEDGRNWLEIVDKCKQAREWYNANAVYLNDGLPTASNFIAVLNSANDFSINYHSVLDDLLKELRGRTDNLLTPVTDDGGP